MEAKRATELAVQLMADNGLGQWSFKLNSSKRCLGICRERERRIELSAAYVIGNSEDHVRDTLLHEIAHALVGVGHGHDRVWKEMCIKLGCTPKACDASAVLPEGAWQARCPSCLKNFTRHRKPEHLTGLYCRRCGPARGRLHFKNLRKGQFKPVEPIKESKVTAPRQLTLPLGEMLF